MQLFQRFDKAFCINLKEREDRLNSFLREVGLHDLGDFETFNAVNGKDVRVKSRLLKGEIGIISSVRSILSLAIKRNYKSILIIEDDCVFNEHIRHADQYFDNLPTNWEMVYLGGNHNTHDGADPPYYINDRIVKLHSTYAAHCIGFRRNMFDVVLKHTRDYKIPLDVTYKNLQMTHNVFGFSPGVATQRPDYSDIQEQYVDYGWLIK